MQVSRYGSLYAAHDLTDCTPHFFRAGRQWFAACTLVHGAPEVCIFKRLDNRHDDGPRAVGYCMPHSAHGPWAVVTTNSASGARPNTVASGSCRDAHAGLPVSRSFRMVASSVRRGMLDSGSVAGQAAAAAASVFASESTADYVLAVFLFLPAMMAVPILCERLLKLVMCLPSTVSLQCSWSPNHICTEAC